MQIYRNTQWDGIKSCSFPLYLQCTSPQKHSAERPAGFFRWGVFLFAFKNRSYEGNRRTRESCRRLPALRLFPLLRGPCDGTIRVLSLSKRLTAFLPHKVRSPVSFSLSWFLHPFSWHKKTASLLAVTALRYTHFFRSCCVSCLFPSFFSTGYTAYTPQNPTTVYVQHQHVAAVQDHLHKQQLGLLPSR